MSFPRSAGQSGDLTPPARPRFGPADPDLPQPSDAVPNLLRPEEPAALRHAQEGPPPAPREYAGLDRDARSMPTPPEKCPNVVAAGARWKGSLAINDSVRVDGQMSGEIDAKGTVHIAEGAQVEAKVKASFVVIHGAFKGEVRCSDRVELHPKSRVQGELFMKHLTVHEGATIDGTIRMSEASQAQDTPSASSGQSAPAKGAVAADAREPAGNGARAARAAAASEEEDGGR